MARSRTLSLWIATCGCLLALALEPATVPPVAVSSPCDVASEASRSDVATLRVTWSGGLDPNGNVTVTVSRRSPNWTIKTRVPFGNGSVEVIVPPNGVYDVQALFDCRPTNDSWIVPVPAGAPNLTVSEVTDTFVRLTWDPFLDPPDTSLNLLYIVEVSDPFKNNRTSDTQFEVHGLEPYTRYTFRLSIEVDGQTQGDWSEERTASTLVSVPHTPYNLTTTAVENTTVELSWEEPDVSTGPILRYRIRWKTRTNGQWNERPTGNNGTNHVVGGLDPYRLYTFAVSAETEAGRGNWSEELEVKTEVGVPHAPSNLTTTSVENNTVELRWEEPGVSTGPILRYRIRWRTRTNGEWNERPTGNNSTNHVVEGLDPYRLYAFAVSAETEAGRGNWSEELEVKTEVGVPHSPTAVNTTSVENTTVGLSWKEPDVSTGPIVRYRIHWKVGAKGGWTEVDTVSNDTRHVVEGLDPYRWYTFAVLAETEAGPGNRSEELEVRTKVGVPHAPTDLDATSVRNTTVGLEWKEPNVSTGPILRYRIRWNASGDGVTPTVGNETRDEVEGLDPYRWYTFAVSAETEAGPGNWSEELEVRTEVGVPHAPSALNTTFVKNTTVGLSWKEPDVSTGPVVRYRIRFRTGMNGEWTERPTGSNETYEEVKGLDPYRWYTFAVSAETEAGQGDWSEELEVRTEVGVPHAPTALNTTSVENTTVGLSWKAPDVSTGPVARYRIRWKTETYGEWTEHQTGSNATNHVVEGLDPYRWYTFAVSAETEAGPGNWSEELEVRTEVGVPHAPTALDTTSVQNTTIGLSWKEPDVSTGPILHYRIRSKTRTDGEWTERQTGSNATNHVEEGLEPYRWYIFSVSAQTEAGRGNWSEEQEVRTAVGVPYAPTDLNTTSVGNRTVGLRWTVPEVSTGPIRQYRMRWKTKDGQWTESPTGNNETHGEVGGLEPYEWYTFAVSAETEAGSGNWSDDLEVRTDVGVPSAPIQLRLDRVTDTTVSVSWHRPDRIRSDEVHYVVGWREDAGRDFLERKVEDERCVLGDLLPFTRYEIRVSAENRAGVGPPAETLSVRTQVGVPLPATIRDVSVLGQTSARVSWSTEGPYPGPVRYSVQAWRYPGPCSGKTAAVVQKEVVGSKDRSEWQHARTTDVEGLTPGARYTFVVLLSTGADEWVESDKSGRREMRPASPGPPSNVRSDCSSRPTEARVSWEPPSSPNGRVVGYHVRFGTEGETERRRVWISVKDECLNGSVVLSGMRPERRYEIAIAATAEGVEEPGAPARPGTPCVLPAGVPERGVSTRLSAGSSSPRLVTLEWTEDAFSDSLGDVVRYAVLLGKPDALGESTGGRKWETFPPWFDFSSGASDVYQATPDGWNPFRNGADPLDCRNLTLQEHGNQTLLSCIIGREWPCPENVTYCNGPLQPDTPYRLKIRGFTRGGYNETALLDVRTGPLPKKDSSAGVAATVTSFLLILAAAGVVFLLHRRGILLIAWSKMRRPKVPRPENVEQDEEMQRNRNSSVCVLRPVPIDEFSEHVRHMLSDSHLHFSQEFEELKAASPSLPCTVAEAEENRAKNRWINIFPFDHSRVKLLPLCDDPGSDFINASYIPGLCSAREYIASQGPLPHTVDDFWRMVWEQSVSTVVMLTQCTERGKRKCEPYWPGEGEAAHYGDLRVDNVSESMLATHVIRVIRLQLGSYERQLKQIHYMHWPDFGCPDRPEDLIEFISSVRDHLPRRNPGPIVVHCSAGVGRTGTFIAVDRLWRQLESEPGPREVDVYGTVLELRRHRTNMVQTEDQYIYIHLCVERLLRSRQHPTAENIYSNVGEMDTSF